MVQILMFNRGGGRTEAREGRSAGQWTQAVRRWLAAVGRSIQRSRMEAELRRKLEGADDHLLRDMGLRRSGERLQRIEPHRGLWDGATFDGW